MRLDRFLANLPELSRRDAQMLIAGGHLRVDGQVVRDGTHEVRVFSRVELDERLLQAGKPARYYMLHKPMGCVSATRDPQHPTVLDLFPEDLRDDLHIGGRLDYNTTGLMLLTNDGQWWGGGGGGGGGGGAGRGGGGGGGAGAGGGGRRRAG
ncbi:pseudouridine synthase, partial [Pseudomonas aeruginosa]|uniref:pseudouridine synthase n=1 Tax=Pseudomonas aeruginosa TaxID=287 RepID=UPI0021F22C90